MILTSGCAPLLVGGIAATAGSIYLRLNGMEEEADAIDELVDEVASGLEEVSDTIESDMVEEK